MIGRGASSGFSDPAVGWTETSRPTASITKGRKPGLSSWWKATPSTPQPHHFMCFTSGMCLLLLSCSCVRGAVDQTRGSAALGAVRRRVVHQAANLLGHPPGELGGRLPVLGPHRLAEGDVDRHPALVRPALPVRHRLGGADDGHRY